MDVVVNMPDLLARQWGDDPQAIARGLKEDAVLERYRTGKLSHRQVGEALGLDYWQTEAFLTERGVPLNYSVADLEADELVLERILRRSS
ncbi:MAG: UPF0175 family protein [Steroidobacteraceae bacterium]